MPETRGAHHLSEERKRKRSKSPQNNDLTFTDAEEVTVANVNNSNTKVLTNRKMVAQVSKLTKKGVAMTKEPKVKPSPKKEQKRKSVTLQKEVSTASLKVRSKPKATRVTQVKFEEDDRHFTMELDPGNTSFGTPEDAESLKDYEDDDDEREVSFKSSNMETENEETSDDEESDSDAENTSEQPSSDEDERGRENYEAESEDYSDDSQSSKKKEIQKLDREMEIKLRELRTMMSGKGMENSVKEIDKMLVLTTARKQGNQFYPKNSNSNANRKLHSNSIAHNDQGIKESNSEATVYKEAVPDKNGDSSSSEDMEIDTSDEMLNLEFMGLNVLSGNASEHACGQSTSGHIDRQLL